MENKYVQQKFPLLYEIYALSDQQKLNHCLYGINELTPDRDGIWFYEYYENLLQRIDQDNWEVFKKKLSEKVIGIHKNARISIIGKSGKTNHSPIFPKSQGFDCFNEVHGYLYLKDRIRCEEVTFLQEIQGNQNKTPDLKGTKGNSTFVLEVKTINTSDDFSAYLERGVREDQKAPNEESIDLDYPKTEKEILKGLENKIKSDVEHAKGQMADFLGAQKIVLFVIDLDDSNVRYCLKQNLKEVDENNEELQIVAGLQGLWRPQNKGFELFYHH
jgi:hypothetical protein